MKTENHYRREFLKKSLAMSGGFAAFVGIGLQAKAATEPITEDLMSIGPRKGYSPAIGSLVSMLFYMRHTIINTIKNLSTEDLDYLMDDRANSVGALALHLGATEKFYQINTFEGREEFSPEEDKIWGAAMRLGDEGRDQIKGKPAAYYLKMISDVRKETLEKLKEKDDNWLMTVDKAWSTPQSEVNTYWKWFHVMEHESNHGGQMRIIRDRAALSRG